MKPTPHVVARFLAEPLVQRRLPPVLGAGLLILLAPLALLGDLKADTIPYLLLVSLAGLLLYGGVALLARIGAQPSTGSILAVALLLRLAMVPMAPSLSDDVYRYLWDGRLVVAGVNPYHHVPADSALARFHDELFGAQGYPTTNTIYPPAAQLLFAGCMAPAELTGDFRFGLVFWKLLLIAAELVAIALMLRVAVLADVPRVRVLLYAWHPLAVVELAGQGHTDALWVLALALGLFSYAAARQGRGIPGIAFGAAVRLHPLSLLPLFARYAGRRQAAVGAVLALPFLLTFLPLLEPTAFGTYTAVLGRFTNFYEFNGGFYYAVKAALDAWHIKPSNAIAGGIGTGVQLVLLLLVWAWPVRDRSVRSLALRALVIVTAQIVLGAKVHIWYFAAPLALLPFASRRSLNAAWLWVALAGPFTYLMSASGSSERMDVVAVEWGVFALLAAWGALSVKR